MEEWKKYKLRELCIISSSKRIFAEEYRSEGVPFFRGKEIIEKQKGVDISEKLYISEKRFDEIKTAFGVPEPGDMLLTSVGTLGVPYIVKPNERFYYKDGNLTCFSHFKGLSNRYLYYWILSPEGKSNISAKSIGSTQKALTIEALKDFQITLPSIQEQEKISDLLYTLDQKIELNTRINHNLPQSIFS